jgi:hypothetical protein
VKLSKPLTTRRGKQGEGKKRAEKVNAIARISKLASNTTEQDVIEKEERDKNKKNRKGKRGRKVEEEKMKEKMDESERDENEDEEGLREYTYESVLCDCLQRGYLIDWGEQWQEETRYTWETQDNVPLSEEEKQKLPPATVFFAICPLDLKNKIEQDTNEKC